MNDLKQKFNWLNSIPSLTGGEDKLLSALQEYVKGLGYKTVRPETKRNKVNPLGVLGKDNGKIFLVHSDRVAVPYRKHHFTKSYIAGQLDNLISIVALLEILENQRGKFKGIVLFSTEEEIVHNMYQIDDFIKEYGRPDTEVVDVDIDPIRGDYKPTDGVSIREKDSMRPYEYKSLVKIARENNIDFISMDTWLICQASVIISKTPTYFTGVPILNYHTNREIASLKSLVGLIELLSLFSLKDSPINTVGKEKYYGVSGCTVK